MFVWLGAVSYVSDIDSPQIANKEEVWFNWTNVKIDNIFAIDAKTGWCATREHICLIGMGSDILCTETMGSILSSLSRFKQHQVPFHFKATMKSISANWATVYS